MRLITRNIIHRPRVPDIWCHGFSRFLGRQLTPAEKTVISALEMQRRKRPRPLMIIDNGRHDSSAILKSYLDYRLATSPQAATAVCYTTDRHEKRKKNPRIRHLYYRQVDSIRGCTPAFMLLLNAHKAHTFSPLCSNPRNFRRICSALFPILDSSGFLVIHIRAEAPPSHAPGIAECNSAPPVCGHDDITETVTVISVPSLMTLDMMLPSRQCTAPRHMTGSVPPHPL